MAGAVLLLGSAILLNGMSEVLGATISAALPNATTAPATTPAALIEPTLAYAGTPSTARAVLATNPIDAPRRRITPADATEQDLQTHLQVMEDAYFAFNSTACFNSPISTNAIISTKHTASPPPEELKQ
jgi:hypothetical protein